MSYFVRSRIRRAGGFTLIELLMVVSILALLISLSLPALGKARARAVTVTCAIKVRNLAQATNFYLSAFNDTFPLNGVIMPKSQVPTMYQGNARFNDARVFLQGSGDGNADKFSDTERWRPEYGALWNYMGGTSTDPIGGTLPNTTATPPRPFMSVTMAKSYICQLDMPDTPRTNASTALASGPLTLAASTGGNATVTVGPGTGGYWSYSVNSVVNSLGRFRNRFNVGQLPWSDPLRTPAIRSTSNFIVFIEEDNGSIMNDEVFDAPAYSQGDYITNRHDGGGHVGMADGHVEFFKQTIFDEVPSGISGTYVSHTEAMASPITRMFFPDGGIFAGSSGP